MPPPQATRPLSSAAAQPELSHSACEQAIRRNWIGQDSSRRSRSHGCTDRSTAPCGLAVVAVQQPAEPSLAFDRPDFGLGLLLHPGSPGICYPSSDLKTTGHLMTRLKTSRRRRQPRLQPSAWKQSRPRHHGDVGGTSRAIQTRETLSNPALDTCGRCTLGPQSRSTKVRGHSPPAA